jgi:hypothetical protein
MFPSPYERAAVKLSGKQPSAAARGYGAAHRARRLQYQRLVAAGGARCARCGKPITPGELWDLGHIDGTNKTEYSGPEHAKCNRAAGARLSNAKRRGTNAKRRQRIRRVPRTSMNVEPESYRDDPERGIYWGPPDERGLPRRWSRPWFRWRT